jgi:methylmalonyl-CoA/ethylmalonyl-CoA epimerase
MIRGLDHVAVVVADSEAALRHFRDRLGLPVVAVDEPPDVPVRLTYLDLGNTYLQLVEPLDPDHPTAAWLAANGEGLHHICLGVDDLDCELRRLGAPGAPMPPLGSGRGRPAGFPAGEPAHGVRIECTPYEAREVAQ